MQKSRHEFVQTTLDLHHVVLTERQSSANYPVDRLLKNVCLHFTSLNFHLVLHHSAQLCECLLTLVTLVRAIWNVVSSSGPSVFKLGLRRQHVPGLLQQYGLLQTKPDQIFQPHLVPSDEVVDPVPCSVLAWAVGAGTRLYVLHSICLRPVGVLVRFSF